MVGAAHANRVIIPEIAPVCHEGLNGDGGKYRVEEHTTRTMAWTICFLHCCSVQQASYRRDESTYDTLSA